MIRYNRLTDKSQTGQAMHRMVSRFSGDLNNFYIGQAPLSRIPLNQFYDIVKNLPYQQDTKGVEIITRPIHLLTSPFKGYDCKKKAILVASWLRENNIPYEFIAVSSRNDGRVHHVIIRALINGEWVQIDPTYPRNKLFEKKTWTAAEQLTGFKSGQAPVLVELYGEGNNLFSMASEFFTFRRRYLGEPDFLGDGGISAAGIVAIIVAALSAAATVTVSIVSAVQSRKEDERAAEAAKQSQAFTLEKIKSEQAFAAEQTERNQAIQDEQIKKYGLIGAAVLGAFFLLR